MIRTCSFKLTLKTAGVQNRQFSLVRTILQSSRIYHPALPALVWHRTISFTRGSGWLHSQVYKITRNALNVCISRLLFVFQTNVKCFIVSRIKKYCFYQRWNVEIETHVIFQHSPSSHTDNHYNHQHSNLNTANVFIDW